MNKNCKDRKTLKHFDERIFIKQIQNTNFQEILQGSIGKGTSYKTIIGNGKKRKTWITSCELS